MSGYFNLSGRKCLQLLPSLAGVSKVSARIGTTASGAKCAGPGGSHSSALGLRLYYDAGSRQSRLAVEDPGGDLYLRSNGNACPNGGPPSSDVATRSLDTAPPTAIAAKCKDSGVVTYSGGNPYSGPSP